MFFGNRNGFPYKRREHGNQIEEFRAITQLKHGHATRHLTYTVHVIHDLHNFYVQYNPLTSERIVTWAADTLGDETPHEVGTILAPVRPPESVHLGLETTLLYTHTHITSYIYISSRLENLDRTEITLWFDCYSWRDPLSNESICIYKAD